MPPAGAGIKAGVVRRARRAAGPDRRINAVAERFFATLKKELIHGRSWPSEADLRTEVFEYVEVFFYPPRRHSTLGFLSPEQLDTITTEADREKPRLA